MCTWDRSIGAPSTVTAPGLTILFRIAKSTKSACSCAGIRVVSAFQNRMSNAGGFFPSR